MQEFGNNRWVTITEGTEIIGYHRDSVRKLITQMSKEPEENRAIRLRRRSYGWEVWLPDLITYATRPRSGPRLPQHLVFDKQSS